MQGPDEDVAAGGRTQALIARLSSTVGKVQGLRFRRVSDVLTLPCAQNACFRAMSRGKYRLL